MVCDLIAWGMALLNVRYRTDYTDDRDQTAGREQSRLPLVAQWAVSVLI